MISRRRFIKHLGTIISSPSLLEIIKESNEEKNYIIIDKFNYSLELYNLRKLIKKYNIELGFNPIDDKIQRGDGCTPEGKFYVSYKNPNSLFHKALLVSYPDTEDAIRGIKSGLINKSEYNQIFNAIKNKGLPLQDTKLGGWIEIHGSGSGKKGNEEGSNWTLGCIALSNKDIDEVYNLVRLGTIIKIINKKQES